MIAIVFVVFMYALWSSIFSIGKFALAISPPIFLTGSRMLIAGAILFLYLLIKKRTELKITLRQLVPLTLLGIFSIYLTNILEFWGLQNLSAGKTCFIYSLSPFFATLLSYVHFKEKITLKKVFGMAIGFAGFLPVLYLQSGSENLYQIFSIVSLPELAIMGAAFFSVYGWVLLRLLVKEGDNKRSLSPLTANAYSMLIGGVLALIHSSFVENWDPLPITPGYGVSFIEILLVITLISNIICYNLYGYMLKRFTATFLSFMGLLSPIFASLNSWLLLKEAPSPIIFLATGIVSLGLWLVYSAELKQGYIIKAKRQLEKA